MKSPAVGRVILHGHEDGSCAATACRAMIDRAARDGDATARDLAAHGYDPESVTPDADKPRYRVPGL